MKNSNHSLEHIKIDRQCVEAYYFGYNRIISERILLIKRKERLEDYRQYFSCITEFGNVWNGFTGQYLNERITIIATGVGPTMVGDCAYAIDKPGAIILYAGTAGGLVQNLQLGDYILADEAICGDGFSQFFSNPFLSSVSGNKKLLSRLNSLFLKMNINHIIGPVFTTSTVVKEIDENFWEMVNKKCIAIEMGTASFYVASNNTNKKACAYFWITDFPKTDKTFWGEFTNQEMAIKARLYKKSIENDLYLIKEACV